MAERRRNSLLQKEIVALLEDEQGLRITEIAKKLERHHSSISRSVKILKTGGILIEDNRKLRLVGGNTSKDAKMTTSKATKDFARLLRHVAVAQLPKEFYHNPLIELQQQLARSILPIIETQEMADALSRPFKVFTEQIKKNMQIPLVPVLARMTIAADQLGQRMVPDIDLGPVFANVSFLTKFQNRLSDSLKNNLFISVSSFGTFLKEATVNPAISNAAIHNASTSVSDGLTSLTHLIKEDTDVLAEGVPVSPALVGKEQIDVLLAKINSDFVQIRKGAWHAFKSDSPDKNRQSAHSMRDLINQILSTLAPGKNKTRGQRLRMILGSKTEARLLDSLVTVVDSIYARLSALSHTNNNRDLSLEFALATSQNILVYVLTAFFEPES